MSRIRELFDAQEIDPKILERAHQMVKEGKLTSTAPPTPEDIEIIKEMKAEVKAHGGDQYWALREYAKRTWNYDSQPKQH